MSEPLTQAPTTIDRGTGVAAPDGAGPTAAERPRRGPRAGRIWQSLGPAAVFLALFVLVAVLRPAFVSGSGPAIIAVQATPILLIALGQSMVLHVGSIDLSNAAMAILGAIVLAQTLGPLGVLSPILVLVLMAAIGALNGALVTFAQVPSFALTLGTLGILQAVSLFVSDSTTVYASGNTALLDPLFGTAIAGLAVGFWIAVLIAVLLWVLLRFTAIGAGLTAVGHNETGALFVGLRTRLLKVLAFSLSGLLAGVVGIVVIAQAGAASSFGLGSDLLLPGIAAALVGGTVITGGTTNPINVIFGALTVALIPISTAAIGVTTQAQSLVYGLVIILAVALTVTRRGGATVK